MLISYRRSLSFLCDVCFRALGYRGKHKTVATDNWPLCICKCLTTSLCASATLCPVLESITNAPAESLQQQSSSSVTSRQLRVDNEEVNAGAPSHRHAPNKINQLIFIYLTKFSFSFRPLDL